MATVNWTNLGTVCLNCIVDIYQNQENRYKKSHSAGDDLRIHKKTEKFKENIILGLRAQKLYIQYSLALTLTCIYS